MEIVVKLIVCTSNKHWHHHRQFINKDNGEEMEEIEKQAISTFIDRTKKGGDLKKSYNGLDISFVGVLESRKVN